MHEDDPEITRVDERQVEERSLGHDIGLLAVGAGASGFLNPLGHDLYDKAKDVLRPSDEEPKIILPPGTGDDE